MGDIEPGRGYVDYVIDELSLKEGEYHMNALIRDEHALVRFDHRTDAYNLHVQPSGRTLLALTDLRGSWERPDHG